ncbi:unnamed protein product [Pylaiella littoralis]
MAISGDPFLAPRSDPNLILGAIRRQLFHHRGAGRKNVIEFQEAFKAWDGDGDHMLSHFEFEKALCRCGVFLPVQEVNALFRRFDPRGEGLADAEEALSALRAAAAAAAATASTEKDGVNANVNVSLREAVDRMKPEGHPEVKAGRLNAQEVRDDFCEFFIGLAGGAGGGTKGAAGPLTVSLEGFREYFRDVGVCEPYDTVFVPMIEALWGVEEPRPVHTGRSELTRHLVPKLKQHSRGAETPAEIFRKTLRYYSLDSDEGKHGGVLGASGVESSLNSFGLYPDKREIEGIFAAVGSLPGQPVELDKILAYLCPPEPPMAPMF